MDPISNQSFSHDYVKFVFQTPDARVVYRATPPPKPFEVKAPEKSEKSKKGKDKGQKDKGQGHTGL